MDKNVQLAKVMCENSHVIYNQAIQIAELREEVKMLKRDIKQKNIQISDLIKELNEEKLK